MSRPSAVRILSLALLVSAASAPVASASTTTVQPPTTESRTFAVTNGGWTSTVDYGSLVCIPGVTCPTATPSYRTTGGAGGAGDGHLRATFGTLLGVLSTTTIGWTSPSFTAPSGTDEAGLSLKIRPQIASLLAIGTVKLTPRLVDVADPTRSTTLTPLQLTAASASFSTRTFAVPAGAVVAGRDYRIRIDVSATTNVSAVTSGNVDLDDVVLTLTDLSGPAGLTAQVPSTGPSRVTGGVDAAGFDTDVVVEYGPTTAYGSTSSPVRIAGSTVGTQPFSVPLADLTAGATYHYRVTATNDDGNASTADATFVAPTPPAAPVPSVSGAMNARTRTVTFARGTGVTAAAVELRDATDRLIDTVADADEDGQVTVVLPDTDGTYAVRVVRENDAGLRSSSADVAVDLDRVGPDASGLATTLTPVLSSAAARTVSFVRPADAATVTAQVLDAEDGPVGAAVAVNGSSASVTLGAADGDYRVRLTLVDAAGNETQRTSAAATRDTVAPQAGPAPTVTGPGRERERTVTFTRAPDATTVAVELLDAASHVIDVVPVPTGASATVALPDADGTYRVRVRQTDGAGNAATSDATDVVLDRVAPEPGPAPAATGGPDALVVAFERAADTVSAEIEVVDASDVVVLTVPVDQGDRATVRLPAAPGRYALRVVQRDAAGNRSTTGRTVAERAVPVVPTIPAVERPAGAPAAAAPAAPTTDPAAPCATPTLVLTRAAASGSRVRVSGWTASAAGTRVRVVDLRGRRVGSAVVGGSGSFTAVVPAPRTAKEGLTAGWRATIGTRRSHAVVLRPDNRLRSVTRIGTTTTIRGRVDVRRVGRVTRIEALGGSGPCPTTGSPMPAAAPATIDARTGDYVLRITTPADGRLLLRVRVTGARSIHRSGYAVR